MGRYDDLCKLGSHVPGEPTWPEAIRRPVFSEKARRRLNEQMKVFDTAMGMYASLDADRARTDRFYVPSTLNHVGIGAMRSRVLSPIQGQLRK
jgi:hypothetical protein